MDRKVRVFGSQLRAAVGNFDELYDGIVRRMRKLRVSELTAIHGDLCGQNILLNSPSEVSGVLDFGFLSTVGDPAFDASIAGGIYNMYGPHARRLDDEFTALLASTFGYEMDRLLLYRAVYSVATSNAYDPLGKDGHFDWCARTLERSDVRAAVL